MSSHLHATASRPRPRILALGLLVLGLGLLAPGCSLFRTVPPEPVDNFNLSTPEQAFLSFKAAVLANNDTLIWRTISDQIRQEQGVTWSDYVTYKDLVTVGYGKALRLLESADLAEVRQQGRRALLRIVAEDMESTVELVRESYYEVIVDRPGKPIYRYYDLLDQGASPFIRRDGDAVVATLRLRPDEALPEGRIVDFRVLDEWRFYAISEPTPIEDPEP